MKAKYILHIPTGMYVNYCYFPSGREAQCWVVLSEIPPVHRIDDTDIYSWLQKEGCLKLHETGISHVISFNEFELIEIEVS